MELWYSTAFQYQIYTYSGKKGNQPSIIFVFFYDEFKKCPWRCEMKIP
jgi:hypothetical protein